MKYSPFYLRDHPEEKSVGDISYIQQLSEVTSDNELQGVENVFEKNLGTFEKLLS